MQPDYISCKQCGEYRKAAFKKAEISLCNNCDNQTHRKGFCWVCRRKHLPVEIHHLAGRKHASNTVPVCLNCHAMLTRRQCDEWPDFWRGERCAAFLLLGFLDYCVLASNPAIPLELFSEQCEEMKVAAVDKAAAALVFLIKIILPVILLALIINVLMQSASKPKG